VSVGKAFEFALRAHHGQRDRAGQAYIGHVVRVCDRLENDTDRIVGLLHDVVEDTEITLDRIRAEFGAEVAEAVGCLTHAQDEPLEDYLARVMSNGIARRVKAADLADNSDPVRLSILPPEDRERLLKKYAKSQAALGSDLGEG